MFTYPDLQANNQQTKKTFIMKIGIITFWQTKDNYGQVLQAFALQQILLHHGHSPFLIRYAHSEAVISLWQDLLRHYIKQLLHFRFNRPQRNKLLFNETEKDKQRHFDDFKEKELVVTDKIYYSLKELRKAPPAADVYITGSDQVWAKSLHTKENETFFLSFGGEKVKRISYAASFSKLSYEKNGVKALKRNLKRFDAISVREKSGVTICKSVGIDAKLVLDPTLLHASDFYINHFNIGMQKGNHIFIYTLNIDSSKAVGWDSLNKYAKTHNLDIHVTPSSGYIKDQELFNVNDVSYKYATVSQWLKEIASSQLVVTPSFHGVAFSILLHVPFVYVPLSGKSSHGNNRVLDLLEMLNIKNCIYSEWSDYEAMVKSFCFDWDKIDSILNKKRECSINFLIQSLSR